MAVLYGLGSCIPMIPFQTFLNYLAPPQPDFDLNATMQSLKLGSEPVLTSSNRWSKFSKAQRDSQGSEDGLFSPMPEIFTKVVDAIVANSGGKLKEDHRTVDFFSESESGANIFREKERLGEQARCLLGVKRWEEGGYSTLGGHCAFMRVQAG